MSEILSIEQLRDMATSVIDIPDFENKGTIKVKVKKPSLMKMFSEGKIPNHLLGIATTMIKGKSKKQEKKSEMEETQDLIKMLELYCNVCLVEPSYKEFEDIMTDIQKEAIFNWAMGDVAEASNFREEEEIQTDNTDGETL